MSIQFLGMIGHRLSSETIAPVGPIFDRDYIVRFAQTHEAAGFDRLLVGHWSDQPDGFLVTALAGLSTQKIQYLLAHRPGFVSPTLAARKFATLEHLLGGRLAVHIISGGNDAEQRRDGDYLDHDQRYARTDAFLDIVRRVDQRAAGGYSQRFLSGRAGLVRHSPAAKTASSDLFWRLVGSGHRRRRQTCRRLRAVGRVAGANRRDHPARTRRSGETPA
ncbi:hypothetical protein KPZU09_06840 [Klebsiella pneumoniae]|uniref:Luciferase-like domain-containing protein n=1 Tax=Klebsiella pneumoniae TaxID=573 RepID=A0A919HP55_KLEPN|nr:hypothetical protein KPZU09_06840 [Klebsiella pneumoniae]